jgi:hypothetical protein
MSGAPVTTLENRGERIILLPNRLAVSLLTDEILLRLNEMSAMTSDRQIKLARPTYSGLSQQKCGQVCV